VKPLVLVVEDDRGICDLLKMSLGESGFRIKTALNGELALGEAVSEDPALILLDLYMPVMDGAEFLRHYRARARAGAKVIVVSGVTNDDRLAKQVVADAFIGKPFDIEVIQRTVHRVLESDAVPDQI
jgi:DNA-binding response OmpR family regulator